MTQHLEKSRMGRFASRSVLTTLAIVGTLALLALSTRPAQAETPQKFGNALDFAPADAAYFGSMLRNGEQIDIISKSKAWAKFQEIPVVAQGLGAWQVLWAFQVQPNLGGEENKQLLDMAGDLLSHEIFYYGDMQSIETWGLLNSAMNSARFGGAFSQLQNAGGAPAENQTKAQFHAVLENMAKNLDRVQTPTIVFGFKHTHADRIKAQLARLEKAFNDHIDEVPALKGRFTREKVGGSEYLTLKLDGGMIPWDQIPIKSYEEKPGEFDKLVDKIKQLPLVISLGIHDDYLLLTLSKSSEHLATLGSSAKLADKPELARLEKFRDKRITGISYSSTAVRASEEGSVLDTIAEMAKQGLPAAGVPADIQARIQKDLTELAGDATKPKHGPLLSVSQLTDRGYESFTWDWSEQNQLDGSKPLDMLEHVGGAPLIVLIDRGKYEPNDYRMLVKWLKRGYGYVEDLAVPKLKPDEQKEYQKWFEVAKPLLARLDAATEKMLLPSLADGQVALVVDAKLTSRSWFKGMPRSDAPLPMAEPAVVVGVSDPDLLKKAIAEYRSIADDAILKFSQLKPGEIPPGFKIPDPQVRETPAGSIYSYPFPKDAGVDYQLAFNAGLGKKVAVVTMAPKHTSELLTAKPFEAEGPAGDAKRPAASAGYLDWGSLVEASTPWVEYAIRQNTKVEDEDAPGNGQQGRTSKAELRETLAQVRSFMEVLKVLRTVSSASYFEEKVFVRHTETHFRDLE